MITNVRREAIEKRAAEFGFEGEQLKMAVRLAEDCVRDAKQDFYSLIQFANNAALQESITPRQLDLFIYDQETSR